MAREASGPPGCLKIRGQVGPRVERKVDSRELGIQPSTYLINLGPDGAGGFAVYPHRGAQNPASANAGTAGIAVVGSGANLRPSGPTGAVEGVYPKPGIAGHRTAGELPCRNLCARRAGIDVSANSAPPTPTRGSPCAAFKVVPEQPAGAAAGKTGQNAKRSSQWRAGVTIGARAAADVDELAPSSTSKARSHDIPRIGRRCGNADHAASTVAAATGRRDGCSGERFEGAPDGAVENARSITTRGTATHA